MIDDERIELPLQLYRHLGQSMVDFFVKKRAEGVDIDIKATEMITVILSFASTELAIILSRTRKTKFTSRDISDAVTGLMKPFRKILEKDVNELIKQKSHH